MSNLRYRFYFHLEQNVLLLKAFEYTLCHFESTAIEAGSNNFYWNQLKAFKELFRKVQPIEQGDTFWYAITLNSDESLRLLYAVQLYEKFYYERILHVMKTDEVNINNSHIKILQRQREQIKDVAEVIMAASKPSNYTFRMPLKSES